MKGIKASELRKKNAEELQAELTSITEVVAAKTVIKIKNSAI